MLSKEEIEKLEEMTNRCNDCGEVKELGFCPDCYMDFDDSKTIRNLFREYKQQEITKQKLIKKLEEDKMKEFDDYTICLIESYLKILKGESNEQSR